MSSATKPRVVTAGVPILTPDVMKGLLLSLGTVFLLAVIPISSNSFAKSLPVISLSDKSIVNKWLSVPPLTILIPCAFNVLANT